MKTFQKYLVGLAIAGSTASPGIAQLAPQGVQPASASFAAQLPADTLIYLEVPDISGLREGMAASSLGRLYHDAELQLFLAESLEMLDEQWEQIRGMSGGMGIPEGLTYWEALESLKFGLAFRGDPNFENPFASPPQIYAVLSIGLGAGLGEPVFQLLTSAVEGQGFELIGGEGGDVLFADFGEGTVEVAVVGDSLVATMLMGEKGAGSLEDEPRFQASRSRTFDDGAVVFGYVQMNTALEAALKGLSFEAPEFHGPATRFYNRLLKPIDSIAFASGWNIGGTFTNVRVGMNGDGDGLYKSEGADLDLLKYIPSDATSFFVKSESPQMASFMMETLDDFANVEIDGSTLKDMMSGEAPEVYTWLFGEKRPELNAAIEGFGTRSFGFGTSMGMQTESMMFSQLTNGPAVSSMMTQLLPRLRVMLDEQESPVRLEMKRVKLREKQADGSIQTVKGPAYYMLDFAFMDEMPPQLSSLTGSLQPTFGVTNDGWLVFSMSKQPVRRTLMNGIEIPEENIRSNADASGFLAKVHSGVNSLSWSDPRPAVDAMAGMAVGMMPMLLGMAGGEMDIPFEADKLPSAELFSRYLRPSEAISWLKDGESMTQHIGSFGFADIFTLAGTTLSVGPPAAMYFFMGGGGGGNAPQLIVSPPPPPPAEEEEF